MVIMPLQAFLAILLLFCFFILFTNCSSEGKNFDFINNAYIINEEKNMLNKIPVENVTSCRGILLCYPRQLSSNSKNSWKPTKAFELTKKNGNEFCNKSRPNGLEIKDVEWRGLIVFKKGKRSLELYADIFPKGGKLILRNIKTLELFEFILNKKNNTPIKHKILKASKVDQEYFNVTQNPQPLLDDYSGAFALKWDIMFGINENIPSNQMFFWKFVDKCRDKETTTKHVSTKKAPIDDNLYSQFTAQIKIFPTIETVKSTKKQQRKPGPEIYLRTSKQDPNILQFRANIYELGCLPGNYEKVHRNKLDKKCKVIDKTYNKECEKGMWKAFQICYKSKLDPFNLGKETDNRIKLQNNPYSGYGRKCNDSGKHGVEMRVCARRVSFVKSNKNHTYNINYKIVAKLGFSYTHKRCF